jgi:hypothetical protein
MKKYFAFVAIAALVLAFTGCKDDEPEPPKDVKVTGVTVTPATLTLDIGAKETLNKAVVPSNATNQNVNWASDKPAVATVNASTGEVTAVAEGTAIITATAADGSGAKGSATVTVNPAVVVPTVTITSPLSLTEVNEIKYSEAIDAEGKPAKDISVTVAATDGIGSLALKLGTANEAINAVLTQMGIAEGFELGSLTEEQAGLLAGFFGEGLPTGENVVGKESVTLNFSALLPLVVTIPDGVDPFDIEIAAKDVNDVEATPATLKLKFVDDTPYVTIVGREFDIDEAQTILVSAKDDTSVAVDIAALKGIENLFVEITSTSDAFSGALAAIGLSEKFDLANPGALATALTGLQLPNGEAVKGKTELEFNLTSFIPMLFGFIEQGDFDASFKLTVADAAGHEMEKTLTLKLVNDMFVSITGSGIDQVLEIKKSEAEETAVDIDIVAPQGIENFKIQITSSSELFIGALAAMEMDGEFDIANPGELGTALTQIGIMNGEAVKGQKEIGFHISSFVPIIFNLVGTCTADFALTVTDTKGTTESKTVKLSLVDDTPAPEPEPDPAE